MHALFEIEEGATIIETDNESSLEMVSLSISFENRLLCALHVYVWVQKPSNLTQRIVRRP